MNCQVPESCRVCRSPQVVFFMTVGDRHYWRCEHCQSTFLAAEELPEPEFERERYNLHENDPQDEGYRQFLNRLAAPLLSRLAPKQRGLDYGCGPGPVLAQMLEEAGHSMALYDPFFFSDRRPLHQIYDFITCTEVVEHFHHPAPEFDQLTGLLNPGGWLAIMTCFQTEDRAFANWHYRRQATHVTFYRQYTFEVIAQQWGYHCEVPRRNVVLLRKSS
ncbi:class I SAM-dependent methyltransferase [Geitlerinema sp. P-1104]|uniref:class I SAM-dependent methyltransferase n=1 Tax=Geitlerinema sp. P-1104 TaxID=2546230 RepID=UPI0019814E91|nr:class I SAM-dependent methyltransferase [Geitlerinema sp. P-1104]